MDGQEGGIDEHREATEERDAMTERRHDREEEENHIGD